MTSTPMTGNPMTSNSMTLNQKYYLGAAAVILAVLAGTVVAYPYLPNIVATALGRLTATSTAGARSGRCFSTAQA